MGDGEEWRLLLSPARDVLGLGLPGWCGASALFASLAAAILFVKVPVAEEPAPRSILVRLVFEEPRAPAPAPAPVEPAEPPAPRLAAPPPEPAAAAAPALPAAALPQPPPPPPPPKPHLRQALAKPAPRPQSGASRVAAPAAPPADEQIAMLRPPPAAVPSAAATRGGLAGKCEPPYPVALREQGIEGRVMLRVEVSSQGDALGVTVLAGSGHDALDRAAAAEIRRCRFLPVAGSVDVPVRFRLEE